MTLRALSLESGMVVPMGCETNPRGANAPSYDTSLSENTGTQKCNLVESLGAVVDDIRQIATDLGARPYTVHAVRVKWSGGEVGRGKPTVSSDIELLPTPKVTGVNSMSRDTEAQGAIERGDVNLTGVSARYTEDDIERMIGVDADKSEECFFEIRIDQRDGCTKRRRFTLARPPERRPTMIDWRISLRRHSGDRRIDGARRTTRDEAWHG